MPSRGEEKLYWLLKEYFPGRTIIKEYTFSNKLRLDFYLPELNLAYEADGPQHQKYIGHFHSSKSEFYIAQNRDEQKEYICQQLGINLVRFTDDQELTLELIADFFPGAGTGEIQPGAERWLNPRVLTKQSKKVAQKNSREKFKQTDAYAANRERLKRWRKKKRQEHKAKMQDPGSAS